MDRLYIKIKDDLRIERNVGYIELKKGYYFSRREEQHLFRKFNGLGISDFILQELFERGINIIIIAYKDMILRATVDTFQFKGKRYFDGKDKQYILPLSEFQILDKSDVEIEEEQTKLLN
jgi:hypothetical protein